MKNITISLDDDTYRQARIKAAERDTSVSALVKACLVRLIKGETGAEPTFDRLLVQEQEIRARLFAAGQGLRSDENLPREALHDRDALR
jgi:plasmid stability protein